MPAYIVKHLQNVGPGSSGIFLDGLAVIIGIIGIYSDLVGKDERGLEQPWKLETTPKQPLKRSETTLRQVQDAQTYFIKHPECKVIAERRRQASQK